MGGGKRSERDRAVDMEDNQSKWCADFLRKVRREFYAMQSKMWFKSLIVSVDPRFAEELDGRSRPPKEIDLSAEARAGLASFLSNFTHLNLPDEAELGVDGEFRGLGGEVYLTVRWPSYGPRPVCELPYDPKCVESIWEKEVITWVSSQFFLFWHDGYSQCTILLGDASCMEREIRRVEFGAGFLASVEDMPAEVKREYMTTDFSPRVEMVDGNPRIIFHIFSPFGGIFRRIACVEIQEEEEPVFPYDCGIMY